MTKCRCALRSGLLLLLGTLLFAGPSFAVTLESPSIRSNTLSFAFQSEANERIVVQHCTPQTFAWQDLAEYTGTGEKIVHSETLQPGSQLFRLKVIAEATVPEISPGLLILKAGHAVTTNFSVNGLSGNLSWSATSLPSGLLLSADGLLTGTPAPEAAEVNETGRHTATIRVVARPDDLPIQEVSLPVELQVRLSFARNIQATRPGGPSLLQSCALCHGPDFKPNIQGTAEDLLYVLSGSGAECGTDRYYVSPGDASDSLIYEKLSERANCGDRMPFGGPYLTEQQINRLARWIRELDPDDTD